MSEPTDAPPAAYVSPSPARVGGLGLATLGVGFAVFYFREFRRLDFAAGRRHSGLLLLGLIPFVGYVFVVAYLVVELGNLSLDRARVGLVPPISPLRHTVLHGLLLVPGTLLLLLVPAWWLGALLVLWSPVIVAPIVAGDLHELWRARATGAVANQADT